MFDTRQMRQPLSSSPLGGGVWRVKWDPFSGDNILTATMHNGFHIVDCSKPGKAVHIGQSDDLGMFGGFRLNTYTLKEPRYWSKL